MMSKYTIRDLPLTIDDVCMLEDAQENPSVRKIRPIIEKYVVLSDGQTVGSIPLADMNVIIEAIMKRAGAGANDTKA